MASVRAASFRLMGVAVAISTSAAVIAACGSSGPKIRHWPSRATPVDSARGWFDAENTGDDRRIVYYSVGAGRFLGGGWQRATDVHCNLRHIRPRARPEPTAMLLCSLDVHDFLEVYLRRVRKVWRVSDYGVG